MKALNTLSGLEVGFVSLVRRAAVRDPSNPTEPMRFALTKSEVPIVDMTAGGATTTPEGGHMPQTEAELRAALEKSEQENAELREQLEKSASTNPDKPASGKKGKKAKPAPAADNPDAPAGDDPDAPEGGDNNMSKTDRQAVEKAAEERIAKAEQEAKEARAEAAEAQKIAKEERDRRELAEHVELAKSELPHLGDPDEVGAELHHLRSVLSKEQFDAHMTRQRAANEQIARSDLFKQFGADGDGRHGGSDDTAKLQAKAAELRKADSNLSEYDALAQALRDNPELVLNNR